MARKKPAKKRKNTIKAAGKPTGRKSPARKAKKAFTLIGVAIMLAVVSYVGIGSFQKNWEKEHDLSVIGNGKVAIVQVHDTGCALCRKLMKNTKSALGDVDGEIQYRIADIATGAGKRIQRKYNVPHVTLLLFDPKGELWATLNGVREPDELREKFSQLLKNYG